MLNWQFFAPRNLILIAVVVIVVHVLAKPLYRAIDAATAPSPDAS